MEVRERLESGRTEGKGGKLYIKKYKKIEEGKKLKKGMLFFPLARILGM